MPEIFSPAPYSHTDTSEVESIAYLKNALNADQIKSFIGERDKVPNIDGYVELVDSGIPIGQLLVQVKTLSPGSKSFPCPTSLFAYSKESTILPVVLIGVDKPNQKIYWRQIKFEDAANREAQKTLTVHFNEPEDVIDSKELYIGKWRGIVEEYKDRSQIASKLNNAAREMLNADSIPPEAIKQLQIFIEELNRLLDYEYKGIKAIRFPGIWKIGVGLRELTDKHLDLLLFGIQEGSTGAQIRAVNRRQPLERGNGDYFISYRGKNIFAQDPKILARKLVRHTLLAIVQRRGLSLRQPFLRNEYLFDFIDKNRFCLGLDSKDSYTLDELTFALNEYLPRWCSIGLQEVNYYPPHLGVIDPTMIRMLLRRNIDADVRHAIESGQPFPGTLIGGIAFSHRVAFDLVADCRQNAIPSIQRIYKKPAPVNPGRFIWSPYTDEQALFNLRQIALNLEPVYKEFLTLNGLKPENLRLYSTENYPDFDKLVCLYYTNRVGHPSVEEFYLKHRTGRPKGERVEVLLKKDAPLTDAWDEVTFDGEKYSTPVRASRNGDFIFHSTPMYTLVYNRLEEAIKDSLGGAV